LPLLLLGPEDFARGAPKVNGAPIRRTTDPFVLQLDRSANRLSLEAVTRFVGDRRLTPSGIHPITRPSRARIAFTKFLKSESRRAIRLALADDCGNAGGGGQTRSAKSERYEAMETNVWILIAVVGGFWCVIARMNTWQRQLGTQLEILLDPVGYKQRRKEEREFNEWQLADGKRQGGLNGWIRRMGVTRD
jgi:hypothetical protein